MTKTAAGIALLVILTTGAACAGTAVIKVEGAAAGTPINPRMHGIFLEEINHGVDGGLYAELIRNRGFEDAKPPEGCILINGQYGDGRGWFSGYQMPHEPLAYWSLIQTGGAKGSVYLDLDNPQNKTNPRSLRLEVEAVSGSGRVGIANDGFWGINCVEGEQYNLSFWARCSEDFTGPLTAVLEDASGSPCSKAVQVAEIGPKWKKYSAVLTGTATNHTSRFALTAGSTGRVWLDSVSLFPARTFKDRPNGLRRDIAQMLADLKPGFVRFPGGCVVEGGTIETAYNWKKTIGPVEEREEIWNCWSYRRTHGMGFFEYLQFIDDIGAEPVHIGFAGQTCAFRDWEHVDLDKMDWVVDGFLDAIEYANGPTSSKWGALRARAGREKPFGMKTVGIGNENMAEGYIERYPLIYSAIKAKYPNVTTIACFEQKAGTEVVDHHYYNNPYWFLANNGLYDGYSRTAPRIYVGEYAVNSEESGDNGNMFGALSEAAFALGMERNGDVVTMASYAPLLANANAKNWKTNLITFDSYRIFGSPSYYAQKMLSLNCPDTVLPTVLDYRLERKDAITGQFRLTGYGSDLEVKEVVIQQLDGETFTSDFSTAADRWTTNGNWQVKDGAMICTGGGDLILKDQPRDLENYTVSMKIRKTGGNEHEGFVLTFGKYVGDGPVSWNVGGWGNKRAAVQGAGVDNGTDFSLVSGQWYDVRVEVTGTTVEAYMDGKLLHEVTVPRVSSAFALAGVDKAAGELVMKVVNLAGESLKAALDLSAFGEVAGDGLATVLKADQLRAENTLAEPVRVVPAVVPVSGIGEKFEHEFAPYSFTVIRVKIK